MSLEETFATMRRLPADERDKLLEKIERWLEETMPAQTADVKRALAAVESTWASISITHDALRWIAENKELEYDVR